MNQMQSTYRIYALNCLELHELPKSYAQWKREVGIV